jgi:hypothetical protein
MEEKQRIDDSPFSLFVQVQRRYPKSGLNLQIELIGREEVLCFVHEKEKGYYLGLIKGPRPSKMSSTHSFDEDGRKFFNDLKPHFGKVWIMIPGKPKIEFPSFEGLLSEIS